MKKTTMILIASIALIVIIVSIVGIFYFVSRRNRKEENNNGNNGGGGNGGGGNTNKSQVPPPIITTSKQITQTLLLLQNKYNVELWAQTQTGLLIQYLNSTIEGNGRYVVLTSPSTLSVGDFSRGNLPDNIIENYFGSIVMQITDEDVTYYQDNHISLAVGTVNSNVMTISDAIDDTLFVDDDSFVLHQYNPPR